MADVNSNHYLKVNDKVRFCLVDSYDTKKKADTKVGSYILIDR